MESRFKEKSDEKVRRLQSASLHEIELQAARRRTAWLKEHLDRFAKEPGEKTLPREAFAALFFDYMRLDPQYLQVLAESENQIVWTSKNPCTTLEACRLLGLDTRRICRRAYEKPVQAFLSLLDPELRFLRDYREIRPYSDHCLERIVRVDFPSMMRIAVEEAQASRREGNKGYGAVIAVGDTVLARSHDTAVTKRDPSLHAEVNAIRSAVSLLGDGDLSGAVLFSSCEPCPMCSSLAVWSNLSAIVFGASIEATAGRGKSRIRVPAREIVDRSPAMIEVIPGVLERECMALY